MSDIPPAERLAELRTLEQWLDWQLLDTRRKIDQVEQQARATGVTEQERKAGQAVGVTIHAADCPKISQPVATLDATKAQYALIKDPAFHHPCQHCRPEKTLGIVKGQTDTARSIGAQEPASLLGRVKTTGSENFPGRRRVVPCMEPINETHVSQPGLAVVEIAACDDQTAFAVQELLAQR